MSFSQQIKLAAAVTFQGVLYVVGGEDHIERKLSTVQRYLPDMNRWQEVASLSIARSGVCAVADVNSLYAIGGIQGGQRLDIVERFDPKEKAWSRLLQHQSKEWVQTGQLSITKCLCLEASSVVSQSQHPVKCMTQLATRGAFFQTYQL